MGESRQKTERAITGSEPAVLHELAKQAALEGVKLEHQAYRCQAEAQQAFEDVKAMKEEGRRRAAVENSRMLPSQERAVDHRTGTYKVMQDAKADHVYYSAQAAMFASLAAMKFAKAAALKELGQ